MMLDRHSPFTSRSSSFHVIVVTNRYYTKALSHNQPPITHKPNATHPPSTTQLTDPPATTPDALSIVTSGPSGVGKCILIKKLFEAHPDTFAFGVPHDPRTTGRRNPQQELHLYR
ncbi:uncharacterized protein BO88DRAFT_409514 [Aspergillus vadensis CBS 113365]|uniref:Guanylate kinase/L-type calcium channel beta subunit domain-containing protein n=1 Tax=Aspergillus vadensis (strain CBS 113365 / IMI 142717 / IBT 24658) TaxID=1448311 RepID=A0A319C6S2_ASPVC|nr:hypothetical protein BO88DRAFT_409514 [Aspergillus vadensis CBS 113365]PYH74123.1 hypothetical protein BO88DRAFT_409514 [Aspergillus vadensis CBS 113365]